MTEANKNIDLTANSMKLNAKLSFTVSIPKEGWYGSVQPCSEQCKLHQWMKQIDFNFDGIPVSMAKQKDSVNVNINPTDIDCRLETPEEPYKRHNNMNYDVDSPIIQSKNFIGIINMFCSQCRKNKSR